MCNKKLESKNFLQKNKNKKKHDPHLSHPVSSRRFRGQHHHWTAAGSHYSARPPPLSHHHHYAPQPQVSVRMKNHVYGPDPPVWQHSTMGTVVFVVSAHFKKSMLDLLLLFFFFIFFSCFYFCAHVVVFRTHFVALKCSHMEFSNSKDNCS